jgi:hypothetical protein
MLDLFFDSEGGVVFFFETSAFNVLHGVISQKTELSTSTAIGISNSMSKVISLSSFTVSCTTSREQTAFSVLEYLED